MTEWKPGISAAQTGRSGIRPDDDFYATHLEAVPPLMDAEEFAPVVWEPACGDGAIARPFAKRYRVIATDLYDNGYGEPGRDFLKEPALLAPDIVTNPPYHDDLPERFVRHALALGVRKLALLLLFSWFPAATRADLVGGAGLARIHVFAPRLPPMGPKGYVPRNSSPLHFAWYVWERGHSGPPVVLLMKPARWVSKGRA